MNSPIVIDNREGSAALAPLLTARGLPVELGRLNYGDISFIGNGPEGCPISVGIEYKQIMDVLKCVTDGRFAAVQLPGIIQSYPVAWLLVEGNIRADRVSGGLQRRNIRGAWVDASVGQRRFMYRDYIHWLQSVSNLSGIKIHHCATEEESIAWISSVYSWWCVKEWHEHKSLNIMYQPDLFSGTGGPQFVRPSLCRKIAATLPGVGAEKSGAVASHFRTVATMFEADESEWRNIPGIGATIAERAWRSLHS